jgi:hypothetical protein
MVKVENIVWETMNLDEAEEMYMRALEGYEKYQRRRQTRELGLRIVKPPASLVVTTEQYHNP